MNKKKKSENGKKKKINISKSIYPVYYILPSALIMLLITVYPLLFQVFMSFTNYAPHHLRLKQTQVVRLVTWDAFYRVPKDFKEEYKQFFLEKNQRKPNHHEVKDGFRETEQYLADYEKKMKKMKIKSPVRKIVLKNPIVFEGFKNFGNIAYNKNAIPNFLNPPEGKNRFAELFSIFKGDLAIPNYNFGRLFIFNFLWTIINVFFHVVLGVMIAMVLNQHGVVLKGVYRSLYILPYAIPAFVTAICWRNMFDDQFGAINQFIVILNDGLAKLFWQNPDTWTLIPEGTRWLQELKAPFGIEILPLSFYAALITNIWLGWPFMMVIATGALQSIPQEMYEAADVDGASPQQKFWQITVPLLRPAMAPAIMLGFIWTFNQFNVIYLVSEGKPLNRTEIMVTQAYRLIQEHRVFGVASSFCIMVFALLFIVNLLLKKVTRATESAYE
ncbi:MAG: sugar ABC transporter permease [Spirochaetes bacterium]|nr:sugar ABC transporter permease [Spirochaetota bacterium]